MPAISSLSTAYVSQPICFDDPTAATSEPEAQGCGIAYVRLK
jgi:hypothetical protein